MSWALAGLATGAGGPGTGALGRREAGPGTGADGLRGAAGAGPGAGAPALFGPGTGGPGRRGGPGRADGPGRGASPEPDGAGEAGALGADPATIAPLRRRATGASTVLDADLTNSPISLSLASTTLLSTPSSLASSCTRAFPATALLTPRSCGHGPHRPHSCTRSLVISGTSSCAHVGRPPCWSGRGVAPPPVVPCGAETARMCSASGAVSRTPVNRSARPKARRRSASAKQAGSRCRCAPRPGSLRGGSGRSSEPTMTNRRTSDADARCRQPTHVRTGGFRRRSIF